MQITSTTAEVVICKQSELERYNHLSSVALKNSLYQLSAFLSKEFTLNFIKNRIVIRDTVLRKVYCEYFVKGFLYFIYSRAAIRYKLFRFPPIFGGL